MDESEEINVRKQLKLFRSKMENIRNLVEQQSESFSAVCEMIIEIFKQFQLSPMIWETRGKNSYVCVYGAFRFIYHNFELNVSYNGIQMAYLGEYYSFGDARSKAIVWRDGLIQNLFPNMDIAKIEAILHAMRKNRIKI